MGFFLSNWVVCVFRGIGPFGLNYCICGVSICLCVWATTTEAPTGGLNNTHLFLMVPEAASPRPGTCWLVL